MIAEGKHRGSVRKATKNRFVAAGEEAEEIENKKIMKCICGGNSILQKGSIEFNTHFLGKILVPDIEFLECNSCGDQLLTPEEGDKAIDYIANKEKELGIYKIKKKDGKWINADKGR